MSSHDVGHAVGHAVTLPERSVQSSQREYVALKEKIKSSGGVFGRLPIYRGLLQDVLQNHLPEATRAKNTDL